ncbi:MAG TPA: hypothetical protein VKR59_18645 [Terriglobales bacterium]|nr:hypothetical protein [Terriglobales bacterium]
MRAALAQSLHRALLAFLTAGILLGIGILVTAQNARAQGSGNERTFRQPKSVVEKTLKGLQSSMGGRLPALEGFALQGEHPLSGYQRAFYQSSVEVTTTASGGSRVRVNTKVTAWYADSVPSRSGYQLLTSNGRLESDLLDQLSNALGSSATGPSDGFPAIADTQKVRASVNSTRDSANTNSAESAISAPMPMPQGAGRPFSSSISTEPGLSSRQLEETKNLQKPDNKAATGLAAEAASLEEVLKNQGHPKNLVAVKKTGTPVVGSPSLTGKTLFLASAHDEFEMLDYSADWVHVRVSGLSRGWIWRTSLEMPEGISDIPKAGESAKLVAADLFQVTREEMAPFPGDWEPLRGKNVKIISVQKVQENEKDSGAQAKLEFVKSLLDKNYADLAARSKELAGVVMIFDSVDGGMIAATLPTVQQWKAGTLTDAALWHQCYFDPPETFTVPAPAGGQ